MTRILARNCCRELSQRCHCIAIEIAAIAFFGSAFEEFGHDFSAGRTDNIAVTTESREPNRCDTVGDPEFGGVESAMNMGLLMGFHKPMEASDNNLAAATVAQVNPPFDVIDCS